MTEKDGRHAFAQGGDADLRARLALEEAALESRQRYVLTRELPGPLGRLARMQNDQRGPAAEQAAHFARLGLRQCRDRREKEHDEPLHSGVSFGTRRCQSVSSW